MRKENPETDKKIRCVLAHSHVLVREGVRRLLQDESDLEVVAEAGNAAETLKRVAEHRPHVLIAEARTLGFTAPEAERLLRKVSPQSRIVFLNLDEEACPQQEVGGLARGDTLRQDAVRQISALELVKMVRYAAAESKPTLCEELLDRNSTEESTPRNHALTMREREVLKLLVEGKTVRSAASVLGLSAKTVDAHKFNLMRKLGVHNKVDLVISAIQMGVVKVPANF
jgi:two-component system, NarL family, response regulator NreC